ncbi:collagen-like triple helix repeat-containing protein, partial [Corynebacterium sp. UBA2622]|uniref:collagen-like triple helix repeat-containing protein n=1 Tax=Corynebacterium sp. UBA2622 TaxID=1946393 RepID=UPI0025C7186E
MQKAVGGLGAESPEASGQMYFRAFYVVPDGGWEGEYPNQVLVEFGSDAANYFKMKCYNPANNVLGLNPTPVQHEILKAIGAPMRQLSLAVGILTTSALIGLSAPAGQATSQTTVTGNVTSKCDVKWDAVSIFDRDKNVKPEDIAAVYKGKVEDLWKDPQGNPIPRFENGGYIQEVSGLFGDPGRFEIQHYPTGSNTVNFRYFIGTDYAMDNAKLHVDLPQLPAGSTEWKFTASAWGATNYSPDAKLPYTVPVIPDNPTPDAADNISLGNLPAFAGITIVASANVPLENFDDTFIAKGELTGSYGRDNACPTNPIPVPETPTKKACEVNLWGQTVRGTRARDVEARDKWDDNGAIHLTNSYADPKDDLWRTVPTPLGEVNADSWDDATKTPSFRLYGATEKALKDVTYTATAPQGMKFAPLNNPQVVTGQDKGMGQVFASGYVNPVSGITGPVLSDDGKTITMSIASMPAKSGFALGVTAITDPGADENGVKLVINSALHGTEPDCVPTPPVSTHPTPEPPLPGQPGRPGRPGEPGKPGQPGQPGNTP